MHDVQLAALIWLRGKPFGQCCKLFIHLNMYEFMTKQRIGIWTFYFIPSEALCNKVTERRQEAIRIKAWFWLHTKAIIKFEETCCFERVLADCKLINDHACAPNIRLIRILFP